MPPLYEYACEDAHTTAHLRAYAVRHTPAVCAVCGEAARYAGLSAPAIVKDKPVAAIMQDGRRVVGTFGTPPKKFRQKPQ